ncbi:tyrosine-type recombinase/integrase [Granulicella tundricola]|uniref:Integrase family protein n=1 Tax=Granulicella tundricola (strain ATCC BAA-1859 / DSM 23138 / MP5ACTX9) TaxID=1198114 RepID=E8X4Y3_GRATM|nr:tyrosine-type recombinase/integrase [Granulicella tundricola]ADW67175.1 integrase family protein [Granulicella tundricola MP5ACTX9]
MNFEPFLEFYKNIKKVSDDTLAAYRSDLKHFGLFLATEHVDRITQIDHALIAKFITYMKISGKGKGGKVGLSDATIARRLAAVSSFFDYTRATTGRKLHNPIEDFSNRWKRNNKPKPVEEVVLEKLLSAITSPRDRVLINLFLATGLRLGEMEQLNRDTIVIEQHKGNGPNECFVIGTGEVEGKGGKIRTFMVSQQALIPYARYVNGRKDDHPALFISERKQRMSERAMQERLAHWCKVAGVSHTNVHRLRHTYGTRLVNAGMDILQLKELMGHSSVATTLNYAKIMDTTLARGYHAAMEFVNG